MIGWNTTLWIDERQHAGLGICPSAHASTLLPDHRRPEDLCQQPANSTAGVAPVWRAASPRWVCSMNSASPTTRWPYLLVTTIPKRESIGRGVAVSPGLAAR